MFIRVMAAAGAGAIFICAGGLAAAAPFSRVHQRRHPRQCVGHWRRQRRPEEQITAQRRVESARTRRPSSVRRFG